MKNRINRIKTSLIAVAVSGLCVVGLGVGVSTYVHGQDDAARDRRASEMERGGPREAGPRGGEGMRGEGPGEHDGRGMRELGGRGMRGELSMADAREAIQILKRIDPPVGLELEEQYQANPREVARILHERFPRLGWFMKMKRYDPEGFDLRLEEIRLIGEAKRLSVSYREALSSGDETMALQAYQDLELSLEQLFDVRNQLTQMMIERLQSKLNELRSSLAERVSQKDELIAAQLKALGGSVVDGDLEGLMLPGRGSAGIDEELDRARKDLERKKKDKPADKE